MSSQHQHSPHPASGAPSPEGLLGKDHFPLALLSTWGYLFSEKWPGILCLGALGVLTVLSAFPSWSVSAVNFPPRAKGTV